MSNISSPVSKSARAAQVTEAARAEGIQGRVEVHVQHHSIFMEKNSPLPPFSSTNTLSCNCSLGKDFCGEHSGNHKVPLTPPHPVSTYHIQHSLQGLTDQDRVCSLLLILAQKQGSLYCQLETKHTHLLVLPPDSAGKRCKLEITQNFALGMYMEAREGYIV